MSNARIKAWVCSVCGYVHYGPEPPEECPVCGAEASQFEPEVVETPAVAQPAAGQAALKIVIVGAGIAGVSAAEAARKAAPSAEIWLLSNEMDLPYYRLNLTRYLAGEIGMEHFDLHSESWYAANNIRLVCGTELKSIDLDAKKLTLDDGSTLNFDRLVLATGARPFLPPVPGNQRGGVTTLRTRRDAESILAESRGKSTVCIGGGILGLETAGALARQGVLVTVLENQAWLMPRQLNHRSARIFQTQIEKLGITVLANAKVRELDGNGSARAVLLDDGTSLPASYVIFSAGVRANTTLAAQAGLAVKQGILVDDTMRTSHPDVFAAGDAVEHAGILYGTWLPAQTQGAVAGIAAVGHNAGFRALPRSNTLKVLGIDLFSIGKIEPSAGDVMIEAEGNGSYTSFLFEDNALAGAILLGDTSASAEVKKAVENHLDCATMLAKRPLTKEILAFFKDQHGV
jgi:nitrite reductase (NADH) large subunit